MNFVPVSVKCFVLNPVNLRTTLFDSRLKDLNNNSKKTIGWIEINNLPLHPRNLQRSSNFCWLTYSDIYSFLHSINSLCQLQYHCLEKYDFLKAISPNKNKFIKETCHTKVQFGKKIALSHHSKPRPKGNAIWQEIKLSLSFDLKLSCTLGTLVCSYPIWIWLTFSWESSMESFLYGPRWW